MCAYKSKHAYSCRTVSRNTCKTNMRLLTLATAIAVAASVYADCSSFGTGATDTVSTQFTLSAFDPVAGTTSPLHLLIAFVEPMTGFHILSVSVAEKEVIPLADLLTPPR